MSNYYVITVYILSMRTILTISLFSLCILVGCTSSNDDEEDQLPGSGKETITLIGKAPIETRALYIKDTDDVQYMTIKDGGKSVKTTNVNSAMGGPNNKDGRLVVTQSDGIISIFEYDFTTHNYNYFGVDQVTDKWEQGNFGCDAVVGEAVFGMFNSAHKLIKLTQDLSEGSTIENLEFVARIYDLETNECSEIREKGRLLNGDLASAMVYKNGFYVSSWTADGRFQIYKINLNTMEVVGPLTLDAGATCVLDNDELYVFRGDNFYDTFELGRLQLVSRNPGDLHLASGFAPYHIRNGKLYMDILYPQPAPFGLIPGIVDLNTFETEKMLDLTGLQNEVGNALEELNIVMGTSFQMDPGREVVAVGYTNREGTKNGVCYANYDSKLLGIVELPYTPNRIFF